MSRRDPFLDAILDGLERRLDPHLFERCVCDALQDEFPGLSPIPGGNDLGMDGAIADGESEAYPLVVTTAQDVSRNLRTSLERYADAGGGRRKVVLATSRGLSATRRRNLEARARDRGFTLVQIIEREGIASRLYRHPEWCSRLLGLSGDPPALSALPPSARVLVEIAPIGREQELAWLRESNDDLVLVGQPGSGKTFLLYQLARAAQGLFLADAELSAIASAVREQSPLAIFVDDAHVDPDQLVRLRHLREETRGGFRLIASTWPAARDEVRSALGDLPESSILTLEGLTRNEIVEVYRSAGVTADDSTLRELVDQASNQPGLAMTLAQIYLRGEWEALFTGQALRRSVCTVFDRLVGGEATPLLAAFALGGDSGVLLESVSSALGLPLARVTTLATELASGGVLAQVPGRFVGWKRALQIRPAQLRTALVGEHFFASAALLPLDTALDAVEDRDAALRELLNARARRFDVPDELLRRELRACKSNEPWKSYAALGEIEALWTIDNYPGNLREIIAGALRGAPAEAVERLLESNEPPDEQHPESIDDRLAPLGAWLREMPLVDWKREAVKRRRITVDVAVAWLRKGGLHAVGLGAICRAMRPDLESSTADPGLGNTITYRYGVLPKETIPAFRSMWKVAWEIIPPIDGSVWRQLRRLLDAWTRPSFPSAGKEQLRAMQRFATEVLRDLATEADKGAGLTSELLKTEKRMGLVGSQLDLKPDPEYELLFGEPYFAAAKLEEAKRLEREHIERIGMLAAKWTEMAPEDALGHFEDLWDEALEFHGTSTSRWLLNLWPKIAARLEQPESWLDLALKKDLPAVAVGELLRAVVDKGRPDWDRSVRRCFEFDTTRWTAAEVVLKHESPPESLLSMVLDRASEFVDLIDTIALRREIPLGTLTQLLEHTDWRVASAAAIGEWNGTDPGDVRPEVVSEWRRAILRMQIPDNPNDSRGFWLKGILSSDSELAFAWLSRRLDDSDNALCSGAFGLSGIVPAAVGALGRHQKAELLEKVSPSAGLGHLVAELVGDDVDLYRRLLDRSAVAGYALAPLERFPDDAWANLATEAVRQGQEPERVAKASFDFPGIAGSGADHWRRWRDAFQELSQLPDDELTEVARHGIAIARERIEAAEARWKQFERQGF